MQSTASSFGTRGSCSFHMATMQSTTSSFGTRGSCSFIPSPPSIAIGPPSLVAAFPSKLTWAPHRRRVVVSNPGVRCQLLEQAALVSDPQAGSKVDGSLVTRGLKERIKMSIASVSLTTSPFDIAWVAMIPSPTSHAKPCFHECLEWILLNQKLDGSWSLHGNYYEYLIKDVLSSTMACIITLKRWNIGEELIQRGTEFIRQQSSSLIDDKQHSHIGFNIVLYDMIQHGKQLGLDIPISEDILSTIKLMCDIELRSESKKANYCKWKTYLGYNDNGIDPIQYYNEVIKRYQKDNGSLFNSPSTTAALLIHLQDKKAMNYLSNVIHTFGSAVPVVYPFNISARLFLVDTIEKLGIAHHFRYHIRSVLDETYRAWLQNDEEIHIEILTCALAFRLLRMHVYDISSEIFSQEDLDELLSYKRNSYPQITTVLELYKASQLEICQNDKYLKKLKNWSTNILKQSLSNSIEYNALEKHIVEEVEHNLHFPFYERLERLEHRRNIETYNTNIVQCLNSSFMFQNIDGADILKFAIDDFNFIQSIYQKELYVLKRWFEEKKLDQLAQFGLNGLIYSYLGAITGVLSVEFYDARIALAKNGLLIIVMDEFFDVTGTPEEQDNMVDLCQRWNSDYKSHCYSEKVPILFDALYTTVEELGVKASSIQGCVVTDLIIESWVDVVMAMNKEAEWKYNKAIPTLGQYIENGYVTFAAAPFLLPSMYFLGERLPRDLIKSEEYHQLLKSLSIYGRLLNDIVGFEREKKEEKVTIIEVVMLNEHGIISEEDAKREVWNIIEANRIKLATLVFKSNGSVVPRGCKELFWDTYRSLFFFYGKIDGLRSTNQMEDVNLIVYEPINSES